MVAKFEITMMDGVPDLAAYRFSFNVVAARAAVHVCYPWLTAPKPEPARGQ
jgi:hypothetical protein